MISVLLVDDEALVRAGLRMILETADDLTVVGEAEDGRAAIDAAAGSGPTWSLMDIRMPGSTGWPPRRRSAPREHPPSVVVLTTFDTDDYVFRALEAGRSGSCSRTRHQWSCSAPSAWPRAGDSMLSPTVTRASSTASPRRTAPADAVTGSPGSTALTEREREVLVEIGLGHTNAEIATRLHMSEATVKSHVSHLFDKLAATNRVQLAIAAFRAGLVE